MKNRPAKKNQNGGEVSERMENRPEQKIEWGIDQGRATTVTTPTHPHLVLRVSPLLMFGTLSVT